MTGLVAAVVPVVGALAVLLGGCVLVSTRRVSAALPVLLDLLLVAGLLRLSATRDWAAIASAALVVLVRQVAARSIEASALTPRPGDESYAPSANRQA